jgi:molybdopterin molybdotransferase
MQTPNSTGCDANGLMPVNDAIEAVLAAAEPLKRKAQTVYLEKALGRVLAEDVLAHVAVPPADNSAMDGYAMCAADINMGQWFSISQRITAGAISGPLEKGTVARIFTGAELPEGADCVIPQEAAELDENGAVRFTELPNAGNWVRPQGQDVMLGQCVCKAGTKLRAADIAMIASVGVDSVSVWPTLRVGILSTGDELINPGESLPPGKIYNSNRYLLSGLVEQLGMTPVTFSGVEDTYQATLDALQEASEQCDVVISTGGVSVGEEDHVRDAVDALGELTLWRIALKPGKPFAFGKINSVPFFGLPGNPASALITFAVFVRPFLAVHSGGHRPKATAYPLPLAFSASAGVRQEYVRVRHTEGRLERYSNQNSGVLSSIQWADGVVVVPPHSEFNEGDIVDFIPFGEWLTG